jgi:hypothetical protein
MAAMSSTLSVLTDRHFVPAAAPAGEAVRPLPPTVARVMRYWAFAVLMATVMTLFTAFQTRMQFLLRGQEMAYFDSVLWSAVIWYVWALLAPLAIVLALRNPVEKGPDLFRALAFQVVFAACFIGLHAVVAAAVMHTSPQRFGLVPEYDQSIIQLLAMQGHWGVMSYIGLIAMVHVGIWVRRAQDAALAREELRTQAASAQLMALARQMQPHFLFNALNALVSMQPEGSAAQVFTIRLADMLRILLHAGERATATLGEELALVQAYLDIERARLGSRLRMTVDAEPALMSCVLPAFILQPLVENAITHGIARRPEGGEIRLHAHRAGDDLVIDISNSCAPESAADSADGAQLTIPNSRRRLALMYGPAARLEAGFVDRNLFRASIILPGNTPAVLQPA